MELLFVIVACVSLLCAVTAVLQVRQIGWAVWLWFFRMGHRRVGRLAGRVTDDFCRTLRAVDRHGGIGLCLWTVLLFGGLGSAGVGPQGRL